MKFRAILFIPLFLVVLLLPGFASAMVATISIPEEYSEVKAGKTVYFETNIQWPENHTRKDLRIEYSVKNAGGEEVAYLKILKAIETQTAFMDHIPISESTRPGLYKIYVTISDYKDLNQEVAASFNVTKSGNNIQTYLITIVGVICIVTLLVVIEIFVLMRRRA
jgi:hypothetical protein